MRFSETFLKRTIELAQLARQNREYPFGALLANEKEIVFETIDNSLSSGDPTRHAELRAISEYCQVSGQRRLSDLILYCNLEPCVMCSGAIHWAHLKAVVFSVSQQQLQAITGGKPKPSCETIINIGDRSTEIYGPIHQPGGIEVLIGFDFLQKKMSSRHR